MYIIPLILILISLIVIIVIAKKKFIILANLDVENMQVEKEAQFKEQIIKNRIKRYFVKWTSKSGKIYKIFSSKSEILLKAFHNKLMQLKRHYSMGADSILSATHREKVIQGLFNEIEELIDQENFQDAEQKLIEIIAFDSKNLKAFELLADVYFKCKNYKESRQTYEHILKLAEHNKHSDDQNVEMAEIYFNLYLVNKSMENERAALYYISKALKIEPNNPRYLDAILEISIAQKNKELASSVYEKLAQVNPENQKLEELKDLVQSL
ncbi:hypothetical protein KJ992_03210 [Patescibacteria group bacterium]|nr:hypothetical protein [Patescibacteria group bacterium]MBU1778639.1 hypothetical protein [Patescibacteria group bacterium]MBU2456615.1 hypothetical protein [Patescibacteria group bacterium]